MKKQQDKFMGMSWRGFAVITSWRLAVPWKPRLNIRQTEPDAIPSARGTYVQKTNAILRIRPNSSTQVMPTPGVPGSTISENAV